MSGIFKFNTDGGGGSSSDRNSLGAKPSFSGPASLSTPTRALNRAGLFMGSHDGEVSFNTPSQQPQRNFTNCPSSPAQGRSLREFEEQLAALRKENFNLKLRIYFLEEKPATAGKFNSLTPTNSGSNIDTIEGLSKRNIDLKVENESLRKEVEEKQELLCQASKAMEMMENQHKKENTEAQMVIDDLNHKIEAMTHEMKTLERALIESSSSRSGGGGGDFSEFLGAIDSRDIDAQRRIAEFEVCVRSFSEQNEQLCQRIEQMEAERCELTRNVNRLGYENAELREKLDEAEKCSDRDGLKRLEDECYESKRRLADARAHFEELEARLREKTEAHAKCLQIIQNACQHIEDLELHVEQLRGGQSNSLSSAESAGGADAFAHSSVVIAKLRQQLELVTSEKNEEIARLRDELAAKSRASLTPACGVSSMLPPANELSFNEVIERNRAAQKKIHFLKQRLSTSESGAHGKIESELLQLQLREAQSEVRESENSLRQSVTLSGVLLERLEELIKFLTSLLNSKDIGGLLGHEIQKAITRAIDHSPNLAASVGTSAAQNLSELSTIEFADSFASSTVAESLVDSLENFSLKTDAGKMAASTGSAKARKGMRRSLASSLLQKHPSEQESEEWSEPDRDCSRERIGLSAAEVKQRTPTTSDDDDDGDDFQGFINTSEHRVVKKTEWRLIREKIKSLEALLQEKNDKILEISSMLLESESETKTKIVQLRKKLDDAERDAEHFRGLFESAAAEKRELQRSLEERDASLERLKREKNEQNAELAAKLEAHKAKLHDEENRLQSLRVEYELKCTTYDQLVSVSEKRESAFKDELQTNWVRKTVYNQLLYDLERKQARLKDYQHKFSALEGEMKIMQAQMQESDSKLEKITRSLDTATLQLSTASVERSKALNEKRSLELKLKKANEESQKLNIERQELNLKIADLEVFNAKLQNRLLIGDKACTHLSDVSGYMSEDTSARAPRSLSFSSTEDRGDIETAPDCAACRKLAAEMTDVRRNLSLSRRSLEIAYTKLRNQNLRKAQIEMDIKQQIAKTQTVLQNVKANMDVELSRTGAGEKKE